MKALLFALLLSPCPLRPEGDLVRWVPESQAIELARKSSKPILYDLTAAWCPPCRLQEKQVFNDPEHAAWINKSLIPVRIVDRMREDRQNPMRTQQLQQKYKLQAFPTLVVDMPSKSFFGNSKWKSKAGYKNPGDTMQFLRESIDTLILGTAPAAPQNLQNGWILAKGWGKALPNQGFNLYMAQQSGEGFKKMNTEPITSMEFPVKNLDAGKKYYFIMTKVTQLNGTAIESKPSQEWSAEAVPYPAANKAPEAPAPPQPSAAQAAFVKENVFFGYGSSEPLSRWGTKWNVVHDDGRCGTKIDANPGADGPLMTDPGTRASFLRFAGHIGRDPWLNGGCEIVSYAVLACDFAPKTEPIDLAARSLPVQGLKLLLKLGPRHPVGLQNYVVVIHRKGITPDLTKNKGSDYAFIIDAGKLRNDGFIQVFAPFPAVGKIEKQPSHFFAQPNWIEPVEFRPWDTRDLTAIAIAPERRDRDFELLVAGISFY